jgi:crossover junction endodeoxyribonuclease RuvC
LSRVLGIDPGFASIGYAVLELLPETEVVIDMGVIHTEKSQKKREVRASDDNLNRARKIHSALGALMSKHQPSVICAETMSFPRNSGAAAKVAMCWGVIASLTQTSGVPIVQASPQEIKKALCGVGSASKEQVQNAVQSRYYPPGTHGVVPLVNILAINGVKKSDLEHPYDALAAIISCIQSEIVRMARRQSA